MINSAHRLFRLFAVAMAVAVVASGFMADGKGSRSHKKADWSAEANRRKADYVYMEAMRQNALGNDDAYFELLTRARDLDRSDTEGSLYLGYYLMALGQTDSTMAAEGYAMMRDNFNAHPDNYYDAIFYGMVNNQLGNNRESIRVWQTLDSLNPSKPTVALKYAAALHESRDSANLRRAIQVLDRIERAEGPDIGLSSHKVASLIALNDTAATLAEVHHLLASSKASVPNSIYAGDVFMALGRPDSAIAYYNAACEIDPSNGLPYYKRAEFYRATGDSIAYDREVVEAVRQDGLDLDVKLQMLSGYIRQVIADTIQRPRIEALFDTLLISHPHETSIRDLFSSYLIAVDNTKAAAEQQEYALDLNPSNSDRWKSTSGLYGQAGNYEKALEIARRGIHYLPADPLLKFYAANSLGMLGRGAEAVDSLHSALRAAPEADTDLRSNILCSIGDELYKAGAKDSAFVYYGRALDYNPENMLALNNCAYFMAEEGIDLDRAERMSAITVRNNPENDTALDTYAWVLFKQKNYTKAREIIDKALVLEADNPQADVLHHAGDIYYMNGDPDEAIRLWTEALKLDPDNALLRKKVKNRTHYYE